MTVFLTLAEVIELHDGEDSAPLLDSGKLSSAVGQPAATWGGQYLYPTLLQQAAALLFGIVNAHAFLDGNKRTAWLSCVTFLDINGVELVDLEQKEVEDFVVSVVETPLEIIAISAWFAARI